MNPLEPYLTDGLRARAVPRRAAPGLRSNRGSRLGPPVRPCPLWVTSGHSVMTASCPLYPNSGHRREVDAAICSNSRFSLAQESRIESRIASGGNQTPGGCQASENIALTRDNALTMLRCVSVTPAHNIVRQCSASCREFFLALLETFEHVVCSHWHSAALVYKLFAASSRDCSVLRMSNIEMGGRN